jgi:hypothetical protein
MGAMHGAPRPWRPRSFLVLGLLLVLVSASSLAAKCHPPNTRVVVFIQGLYTTYDADGTQSNALEGPRFSTLKRAFLGAGYEPHDLLDYSYAGGSVAADGRWRPAHYACELTDRTADESLVVLEQMLRDYRQRHPDAHFTLVGHSLGGYLAFLEGAREARRPDGEKLGIDAVITLDAPLQGASPDKRAIIDLIPCEKTYVAGAQVVADKLEPATPEIRRGQAREMAEAGIRLATLGNTQDCLWNTGHCLPGATWIDDGATQYVDGAELVATYAIDAPPLLTHDAILAHAPAVAAVVGFAGPP